jgi:hypothetical protein
MRRSPTTPFGAEGQTDFLLKEEINMDINLSTRKEWIASFTLEMDRLEIDAPPSKVAVMAAQLYPILRDVDPAEAALSEFSQWARQDS